MFSTFLFKLMNSKPAGKRERKRIAASGTVTKKKKKSEVKTSAVKSRPPSEIYIKMRSHFYGNSFEFLLFIFKFKNVNNLFFEITSVCFFLNYLHQNIA